MRLLDQVRERTRYVRFSLLTEQAYLDWVRALVRFHGMRHPRELGGREVEQFPNTRVNEQRISASTHKQALCALLLLYREVLDQNLPWMQQIQSPAVGKRIAVVFTVDEVRALLGSMSGEPALVARLLCGTGMRLMEAMRLRIKDVDFARRAIVLRDGKVSKDRGTMLPQALPLPLRQQASRARCPWDEDRQLDRIAEPA